MTHLNHSVGNLPFSARQDANRRLSRAALCVALALGAGSAFEAWAAEIVVPSDSIATVQEAVDAAAPGDTIKVLPGSYDGVFIMTPGLTLKAESETGPVVVNDFFILAEGVRIQGFNVSDGITLIDSTQAVLSHNSVAAVGVGILVLDSPAVRIEQNTVNAGVGVLLSSSADMEVDHNEVAASDIGISVEDSSGVRVHHNHALATDGAGIGVFISSDGRIEFNSVEGIRGIDVSEGSCGNVFAHNSAVGSQVGLYSAENPSAPCNTFEKNRSATAFPSLNFWGAR
jgi:nitrous oxidase accessory protein NosD